MLALIKTIYFESFLYFQTKKHFCGTVCWLISWFKSWLVCRLICWFIGWLISRFISWLISRFISRFIRWLISWFVRWLICWLSNKTISLFQCTMLPFLTMCILLLKLFMDSWRFCTFWKTPELASKILFQKKQNVETKSFCCLFSFFLKTKLFDFQSLGIFLKNMCLLLKQFFETWNCFDSFFDNLGFYRFLRTKSIN